MIDAARFHAVLVEEGVGYVAGVPDSLLKEYCAYAAASLPRERHLIAANEGSAVAAAAGYHLATGHVGMVYLQNSGLGNTVNPLLSLADPEVYALPLVLLIGWRGEPGVKDEPQHVKQGRVTPAMLDAMGIPYRIVDGDPEAGDELARWSVREAASRNGPAALVVRKGAFEPYARDPAAPVPGLVLGREQAIESVAEALPPRTVLVSTTGMISRELYEHRVRTGQDRSLDFLTVGSMGHALQIAVGIASGRPDLDVACLDGDGAAIMHMGGLATLGAQGLPNLRHIVLNNGVHDSVGAQPTAGLAIDLTAVARACGYRTLCNPVSQADDIAPSVAHLTDAPGPGFLEVRVKPGARSDLGRPRETPLENKRMLMERLRHLVPERA